MGYADLAQVGSGLRQRIYSRAFLVSSPTSGRIMYVNADIASGDTAIRFRALERLQKMYPGQYSQDNFAVVGTHSHAGPGGYMNYLLPTITTAGIDKQNFEAIVSGIVESCRIAHESASEGYLYIGKTVVKDGGINRSQFAYLQNPEDERKRYSDDVDREMTMLVFENNSGEMIGYVLLQD